GRLVARGLRAVNGVRPPGPAGPEGRPRPARHARQQRGGGLMRRRRWTSVVSAVVLAAGAVVLTVSAVFAQGFPVRHVELNDGGIWVTSDNDGLFGRLNKPAGSLDAAFYPPGGVQQSYTLDVVQDGAAVAAWDRGAGKLFPVDVSRGLTVGDQGLAVGAAQQVRLAGGSLAVLD